MDLQKRNFYFGLVYVFLTLLQICESLFPWVKYCGLYFSLLSIYADDNGLSNQDHRLQSYSSTKQSLCTYFAPTIQNACPDFCINTSSLQNSSLLLFICTQFTTLSTLFISYLFLSKSRKIFQNSIPSSALWSLSILKPLFGVLFFQTTNLKSYKATWQTSYDVHLSFGFFCYILETLCQVSTAYLFCLLDP